MSPAHAVALLSHACQSEHHAYWPCDVSLLDQVVVDRSPLPRSRQVTDAYLLALAVAHGGRFVTFDRSLPLTAVVAAEERHRTVL